MGWGISRKDDLDNKCNICGGEVEVASYPVYPDSGQLDMFEYRTIQYMWRCVDKDCPMVAWNGGKPRKAKKTNAKGSSDP